MNKNENTLRRRRNDLIATIERSERKVIDVIADFAEKHYLSESTVWKDYERALDEIQNQQRNGRGSKHH